jgi:cation diffusion facilitator family transporter
MNTLPATNSREQADREKRAVALSSLLAALVLTAMKLIVGWATNSLGILSEAAHSGLDLVAAGMTFWAVRISSLPADSDHTYGHGKFENLSALVETLLLLLTCVWIVYESFRRLVFAEDVEVDANLWAFLVIGVSIVIDYSRSRALAWAAEKHKSQALEADALHFSTDIWSSCVVLLGLAGTVVAGWADLPWLEKADALAALGVALIVVSVSMQLGKKSLDDLLDRIPEDLQRRVREAAGSVSGVKDVTQVRVRRSGPEVFADVTLQVDRAAPFEGVHDITSGIEEAVRAVVPAADVVVHAEPISPEGEDCTTVIRLLAARSGMGAHAVRFYESGGRRTVELHLEVGESLTLEEAHARATEFEHALHSAMPKVGRIVTHLEPAGDAVSTQPSRIVAEPKVEQAVARFFREETLPVRPHDLEILLVGPEDDQELAVSLHCAMEPSVTLTVAHDLTVRLERFLRTQIENLGRVVIHVEPQTGED